MAPRTPAKHSPAHKSTRAHVVLGTVLAVLIVAVGSAAAYLYIFGEFGGFVYTRAADATPPPHLDIAAYNAKLLQLAHLASTTPFTQSTSTAQLLQIGTSTLPAWPATAAYPLPGALLPFNRIVAYYGNFYSSGMGVLGEQEPAETIKMLASTSAEWAAADPSTPVIPAIDYIAIVAQGNAGKDGKYRLEMPDSQIDQALAMAAQLHGIVILDVQVGLSTVQAEVPTLEKYLAMPNVMLALDPEFEMHNGARPDSVIGSTDASEVNWAAEYLANLVRVNHLPPKVLIVHRFTDAMIMHPMQIKPLPEVQVVIDMDGWGSQAKKINTYMREEASTPIQFTGFKLFYKNDLRPPSTGLLTPAQVLGLTPAASFIQYQ